MSHQKIIGLILGLATALPLSATAEDGYRLWLSYDRLPERVLAAYRTRVASVVVPGSSPTLDAIRTELVTGCSGLLGQPIPVAADIDRDSAWSSARPRARQSSPAWDGAGN